MTVIRIRISVALAAAFGIAAIVLVPRGLDAYAQLAAEGDPVALSDRALARIFDRSVAAHEIEAALAADDSELARSFLDLARERGVAVAPALADRVAAASETGTAHPAKSFARGFVIGAPDDLAGLAGTAFGDLFVYGDVRDVVRESFRYARGETVDGLILGLAGAGLAVTAGTYVSLGATAPVRMGLTLLKVGRRTGTLTAPLLAALRVAGKDGLVRVGRDFGKIQARAGTRGASDALKLAENPKDVSRLARLAEAKGGKTRAILKVAGRAAISLTVGAWDLAAWIFAALLSLLGFCASLKKTTERATERYLVRRKLRIARNRERQLAEQPMQVPPRRPLSGLA